MENELANIARQVLSDKWTPPIDRDERRIWYAIGGLYTGMSLKGRIIWCNKERWGNDRSDWGAFRIEDLDDEIMADCYEYLGKLRLKPSQTGGKEYIKKMAHKIEDAGLHSFPWSREYSETRYIVERKTSLWVDALDPPDECYDYLMRGLANLPIGSYDIVENLPWGVKKRRDHVPFNKDDFHNTGVKFNGTFLYQINGKVESVKHAIGRGTNCIMRTGCPHIAMLGEFREPIYFTLNSPEFKSLMDEYGEKHHKTIREASIRLEEKLQEEHLISRDECNEKWSMPYDYEWNSYVSCKHCNPRLGNKSFDIKLRMIKKRNPPEYATSLANRVINGLKEIGRDDIVNYYVPILKRAGII